ncbi:MAG: DUF1054 family protein [Armatimonadota bacterium]
MASPPPFPGFEPADFELFQIPDFAGRMAAIRAQLRPKLVLLGEALAERVAAEVEGPVFPHVAQHMRRRVNPPAETWVAFGRDRKGYKRWTHYRVAVSEAGVRVTVFVEDDADDKPAFGARLAESAAELHRSLSAAPGLTWFTFGEAPVPYAELTPERLQQEGERLATRKTAKFQAGIPLPASEALALSPDQFEAWALEQVRLLKPLYLAGVSRA